MRSQAVHIVLVIDEWGGFAGLATLDDVLESLLGPVPDEYGDEGRDAIRVIGDGVAIVGATARLHEIERVLDVPFPEGSVAPQRLQTLVGGLLTSRGAERLS
jgi:CBS domain containing-hemolysin-like protein